MILPIDELEITMDRETENLYYFNDRMLNDGVFIKYMTFPNPEIEFGKIGHYNSYLEVGCLNDDRTKAGYYVLYFDTVLYGIQLYQMMKNVYEIYLSSSCKDHFIEIIQRLSCTYRDSTEQGGLDIIPELKKEIELIRYLAE